MCRHSQRLYAGSDSCARQGTRYVASSDVGGLSDLAASTAIFTHLEPQPLRTTWAPEVIQFSKRQSCSDYFYSDQGAPMPYGLTFSPRRGNAYAHIRLSRSWSRISHRASGRRGCRCRLSFVLPSSLRGLRSHSCIYIPDIPRNCLRTSPWFSCLYLYPSLGCCLPHSLALTTALPEGVRKPSSSSPGLCAVSAKSPLRPHLLSGPRRGSPSHTDTSKGLRAE